MSERQNTEEQTTVGAYIRRLRSEKNISADEMAAKMYLRLNVIEALEQDDHDKLPEPIYVYGYLQHYAKILDVPADKLVAMYKKDTAEPREQAAETPRQVADRLVEPETKPEQPTNWSYAIIYLVLFILVLASLALWRGRYTQEQVERTGSLDYPITVVEHPDTPFYPAPSAGMEEPEPAPAPAETPAPQTALEYETAQDPETAAESLATQVRSPETPAAAESDADTVPSYREMTITFGTGPDTVKLVLSIDCWVEIFDADNEKVFYDLARVGQTLVLSGTAPFSVLLGNADAATVEFNNTPFDITPHVTGIGIARFMLGEAEINPDTP